MSFDITALFRDDLPPPAAARFSGLPPYNFVGGNNDADSVPVEPLVEALGRGLREHGRALATYNMDSGPQGHRPLREAIATILQRRAGIACSADDLLVTSGSLQALDLVYDAFVRPGDAVLVEEACYFGALARLRRRGAELVGVGLDEQGLRPDSLAEALEACARRGKPARFLYTIPTVQNPTGTVMPEARRLEILRLAAEHDLVIFEDDCYADLTWNGERPKALRALDDDGRVVYCGTFSKTIAPALRTGYIVADWPVLRQLLPLKSDGGTPALEQLALAEFLAREFDGQVGALVGRLQAKCDAMLEALAEQFGTTASVARPRGGIFLWVELPPEVDTSRLFEAALKAGVALNPGREWSVDGEANAHRMRLCFGSPTLEEIREGIARLAEVCHREFGVPLRSANVERQPG